MVMKRNIKTKKMKTKKYQLLNESGCVTRLEKKKKNENENSKVLNARSGNKNTIYPLWNYTRVYCAAPVK